ncbi:Aspartyl-tRNA(Asn) amidotransferase subunit C amidotransferase subunit C [Leucobacter sp. 7(1)]|uniref:Asp-tRNA(Asn)/Glu-tRNA(Gln) amidotransferase subunit GatC n=1 Tax=Leucobacter sp. 7(1) TaxID=1255613 RepID=UPI00097EF463|nr:Asp-tRNA(Asn)/Glu-tRNA(Gln) amidotransferase subunit GatC [Leucobacter sp. 7(1)]SJN12127.1 Aspartyl-tRNA(Asn) amidotransferase subunit C amidotransferase subunit C [Leucobacter sp. 7(1)]
MPETSAADPTAPSGEITAETVQHLAGLARIALTDTEIDVFTSELGSILTNVAKVSEVVSADVPATSHPIPLNNVTRADEITDVLTREQALANAPETTDHMFRVSSILGEEQ